MSHDNVVAVGIDGSESATKAMTWALAQAKARGARLHLVCSYELPTYAAHATYAKQNEEGKFLYEAAEVMIKDAVAKVSGQGVEVTYELFDGDPTSVLVELSKKVALIVVGGRKQKDGKLIDRVLRTTSSAVPAYAYCPTVVVPNADIEAKLPVKHIVVGVDGSEHAKLALQRAVWEADRWGAKLSVVATVNTSAVSWGVSSTFRDDLFDDMKKGILAQLAEVDEGRKIDVHVHAVEGNPALIMTEFSYSVDMLIMGTRGRGGFRGVLLGSTSQTVLEHTDCPTMIVPRRVREGDDQGPEIVPPKV